MIMNATDGTSPRFVLLDRAIANCASILQHCRTRLGRFRSARGIEPGEIQQACAETIVQQLTRVRLPNGRVEIRGTVLAEFAAGDRLATTYVGFCPPFEMLPKVEAVADDGVEVELIIVQALHNGVQIEIRLSEPAEESVAIPIEFFARAGDQHDMARGAPAV
jgi:hypothetical protein